MTDRAIDGLALVAAALTLLAGFAAASKYAAVILWFCTGVLIGMIAAHIFSTIRTRETSETDSSRCSRLRDTSH